MYMPGICTNTLIYPYVYVMNTDQIFNAAGFRPLRPVFGYGQVPAELPVRQRSGFRPH